MRRFLWMGGLIGCASDQGLLGAADPPSVEPNRPPAVSVTQTDSFRQVTKPEVDVLWVVDNSSSMAEEQADLTANFPVFMDYFLGSSLDYHIGVVSTDMENPAQSGRLIEAGGVRWIDDATPDPSDVFSAMANLGTGGSHAEEGVMAAYAALEMQQSWNDGFFRESSAVQIIVVSDEEDVSPESKLSLDEFVDYLHTLRPSDELVGFNSIVAPAPPAQLCATASSPGTRYLDITRRVGGVEWSICAHDWIGALEKLGLQSVGLKREYFLSEKPVDGTVVVTVVDPGGTEFEFFEVDAASGLGDYTYSEPRNSITFVDYVPAEMATVQITYDVLSAAEHE